MDFDSLILGVAFILICASPFVLIYFNGKKTEKRTLQLLSRFATQNNSKLSQSESCGDFAIGLDETLKRLLFVKKNSDNDVSVCIDLNQMEACIPNTTRIPSKNTTPTITYVGLGLVPQGNKGKETTLIFYDERINTQLTGELQLAEKWSKNINSLLKNKNS